VGRFELFLMDKNGIINTRIVLKEQFKRMGYNGRILWQGRLKINFHYCMKIVEKVANRLRKTYISQMVVMKI